MALNVPVELNDHFNNITDCFSCADGGVKFVQLMVFIEELHRQSKSTNGRTSADAETLLNLVRQFSRLINYASAHGSV